MTMTWTMTWTMTMDCTANPNRGTNRYVFFFPIQLSLLIRTTHPPPHLIPDTSHLARNPRMAHSSLDCRRDGLCGATTVVFGYSSLLDSCLSRPQTHCAFCSRTKAPDNAAPVAGAPPQPRRAHCSPGRSTGGGRGGRRRGCFLCWPSVEGSL